MALATLVFRLLVARARFLCYLAFIVSVTVFFYWISGGFEDSNLEQAIVKPVVPLQPNKIDTQYPPAIKKYCNYPLWNMSHDALDGAGLTNLRLRGLIVVTRHGDRAPLLPIPQHLNVPRCGLWTQDDADLFHQYRTDLTKASIAGLPVDVSVSSFSSFLTAPPNEKCRAGHLSAVGAVQMIRLGRRLREHYRTSWSFPSPTNTECKPRSTMYPRTYQSALAFLYGWTGGADGEMKADDQSSNNGGNNRKCTLGASETTYFCSEPWCMCPNRLDTYRREMHARLAVYTRKETKDKDVRGFVQKIGAVLETPKLEDPVSALDTMMGYACHREAMPCNHRVKTSDGMKGKKNDGSLAKETCVEKDWLPKIYHEAKNANLAAFKADAGRNLANVESAPMFGELARLIEELAAASSNNDENEKEEKSTFEYYSGHDISLRPLLASMEIWDGTIPPYASYLAFEIVEDRTAKEKDTTSRFYFRVLYNSEDLTEKVTERICKRGVSSRYNEAVFKLCSVDGLIEYARSYVQRLADGEKRPGDEWVKLCK